ncbi:c-type cytochrome [Sphingobacterium cellulitidis]|uniref:c-type cytochrome n=1 Tax=Sphingobacterium cellulitidis TaxID=1768011 RepID=UPI001181B7CC|nr:c-type cytochrome [Sphingobacterium cellulitidis]
MQKLSLYILLLISVILCLTGCNHRNPNTAQNLPDIAENSKESYIRAIPGEDEDVDSALIEKGKVLLSDSDCYTCHRPDKKVLGPSFHDINRRYPRKEVFINILAQRVILGGSGAWGTVIMKPHPKLSTADAEAMLTYILSLSPDNQS